MEKVPKIALLRLQASAAQARRDKASPGEAHPDADLLTAFTEHSLAEGERARVMEHLARCGDCREVVALALPDVEAVAVRGSVTAARNWLSWPVLRWSVVAAGILLVASVGVLQYQQRHQPSAALNAKLIPQERISDTAAQSPSPAPATASKAIATPLQSGKPPEPPKPAPPNAHPALPSNQSPPSARAVSPQLLGRGDSEGATARSGNAGGADFASGSGGHFVFAPSAKNAPSSAPTVGNPSPAPARRLAVPSSSETVEVSAAAPVTTTPSEAQDQLAENQPAQTVHDHALANLAVVDKAKKPVSAQAVPASAPAFAPPAMPLQTSPGLMQHASPRWTISSAGALQRSFDAGKTWEDVNVVSAMSASLSKQQGGVAGGAITENRMGVKKTLKENVKEKSQPNSTPVFRAVSAVGPEVWAGGSAAMLCHSVDSGTNWIRVLPTSDEAVLTGDITAIEFSGPQNGRITTSTYEIWTTADDGQTWRRQP